MLNWKVFIQKEIIQKEVIKHDRITKDNITEARVPGRGDSRGMDSEGKDSKGGELPKVEEDPEPTGGLYSSQTAREQDWRRAGRRNEYSFNQRGS